MFKADSTTNQHSQAAASVRSQARTRMVPTPSHAVLPDQERAGGQDVRGYNAPLLYRDIQVQEDCSCERRGGGLEAGRRGEGHYEYLE